MFRMLWSATPHANLLKIPNESQCFHMTARLHPAAQNGEDFCVSRCEKVCGNGGHCSCAHLRNQSSIRKCFRTCSSSRCNGSLRFIRCSMLDVGRSRFPLLLTAAYADNTDLTWNQRPIWKTRKSEIKQSLLDQEMTEKGPDVEENFLTSASG